jgi:hypothetical protein
MIYFTGQDITGHVVASECKSFAELTQWIAMNRRTLAYAQAEFAALPKPERDEIKRSPYVVAAAFKTSPSPRRYEAAVHCNLIALDIDDHADAQRVLGLDLAAVFGDLAFIIWHTANSTAKQPRLRVIVSATQIPIVRYADAVRTVAGLLGLSEITTESRVAVQPMYLPVQFEDQSASPIFACASDGEALTVASIGTELELVDTPDLHTTDDPDNLSSMDLENLRAKREDVTLDIARGALEALDPDCPMQQWIEVAMGLKHQFGDAAFDLWDEWSAKGEKYTTSKDSRYRWGTLREQPNRRPVTINSVLKYARDRGWTDSKLNKHVFKDTLAWIKDKERSSEQLLDQGPARILAASETLRKHETEMLVVQLSDAAKRLDLKLTPRNIKQAVAEIQRTDLKSKGFPAWTKDLVFVTSQNLFYRLTTHRRFKPDVIDLLYSTPIIGEQEGPRARDYLVQTVKVPEVEALRYEPAREERVYRENGVPYLNTYIASYPAEDQDNAAMAGAIFHEHIRNLVAEPEYQTLLIDFLAFHVQQPGRKIRWATLIQGGQGCGKTALAVAMSAVLGRGNTKKLAPSNVMEPTHNAWAAGHQLVAVEEVRIIGSNRHAVMDKLKPCISDDEVSIRAMATDPVTVPNITNYLMFTNHHDALAVNEEDRRYFVVSSPLQRPEHIAALGGSAYFKRLFTMIAEHPGALRSWLMNWKLSDAFEPDGRAPITTHLRVLAANSASPLAAAVMEAIEDRVHPLIAPDLVSLAALRGAVSGKAGLHEFSDQLLSSVMRELGYDNAGRVQVEGERHSLWTKRFKGDARGKALERMLFS